MSGTDAAPVDGGSNGIELGHDTGPIDLPASVATMDRAAIAQQHTMGAPPATGIGQAGGGDADLHHHAIQRLLSGPHGSHQPVEIAGLAGIHINRGQ